MPENERLRQHRIKRNWSQQELADQLKVTPLTVRRWERGTQQPRGYYRVQLCKLFDLSPEELGLLEEPSLSGPSEREAKDAVQPDATLPDEQAQERLSSSPKPESPWNVPFARNPFFTGRSQLLERLHEQLSRSKSVALTQSAALSGLGGIGKTQTAIEYAYRYRDEYRAVFWVRADSRETLIADSLAIAQLLCLPGHDAEEACTWYTRALAIREQALGAQHLKTTQTRTRLIDLLHAMGQHEDAAQLEAVQR